MEQKNLKRRMETRYDEFTADFERLWSQNSAFLGRALQCHLMLEWAITKFLEKCCPLITEWDSARLSFSQKVKLTNHGLSPISKFKHGIRAINKLRNLLAHNPDWNGMKFPDLEKAKFELINHLKETKRTVPDPMPDGLSFVEFYVHAVCPYIAGAGDVIADPQINGLVSHMAATIKERARITPE